MKRVDVVNAIYSACDEDMRLTKSRSGQLESITTMRYIHALLPEGAKVLEVGAGTGRYFALPVTSPPQTEQKQRFNIWGLMRALSKNVTHRKGNHRNYGFN